MEQPIYHGHPIFEFFLTFYVGYLISRELRETIIKSIPGLFRATYEDDYNNLKVRFNSLLTKLKELEDRAKSYDGVSDGGGKVIAQEHLQKIEDHRKALKKAINKINGVYGPKRTKGLIRGYSNILIPLRSLIMYSVLFSFMILLLNVIHYKNYAPLVNSGLVFFNIGMMLFMICIQFPISFFKNSYITKVFQRYLVATTIFILWLGTNIVFHESLGNRLMPLYSTCEKIEYCAIFTSILLLIIPILLHFIKAFIHRYLYFKEYKASGVFKEMEELIDLQEFDIETLSILCARDVDEIIKEKKGKIFKEHFERLIALQKVLQAEPSVEGRKVLYEQFNELVNITRTQMLEQSLTEMQAFMRSKKKLKLSTEAKLAYAMLVFGVLFMGFVCYIIFKK